MKVLYKKEEWELNLFRDTFQVKKRHYPEETVVIEKEDAIKAVRFKDLEEIEP